MQYDLVEIDNGRSWYGTDFTPNFWHRSPQNLFTTGNETRFSKVQQKSPKPFFPFSQPVSASLVVPIPIHVEFF
jgi:hypothetical protein